MAEHTESQNDFPSPPTPIDRGTIARLFFWGIVVYFVVCAAEFIFVARAFGVTMAIALSLLTAMPLVVAVRMRSRWTSLNALDSVPLTLVVVFATWGNVAIVQGWYKAGLHQSSGRNTDTVQNALNLR